MPVPTTPSAQPARVLSGMRPTGALHWGNYFGALANWVALQSEYECFFFIADLHSLTTDYAAPGQIKDHALEVACDWLAAGVDPEKSCLFVQSWVPEHAELYLLLSMLTPLSWLERVPTFKEQQQQLADRELSTHGFLGYPMLQTADIILYKTNFVPVGEDQLSHLEISRELVRRFHHLYHTTVFPEPQPLLTKTPRVPGLDRRKMSKSYQNAVYLKESGAEIQAKMMPAVTDPARVRRQDPGNPDVCVIGDYHQIFSDAETRAWVDRECRRAGIGCVDCKKKLLESVEASSLREIRERRAEWVARRSEVEDILRAGSVRAQNIARATLEEVKHVMGLV